MSDSILVAKGETEQSLLLRMANRHGLIAGATGTGKTVTLRVIAEGLSACGVPVFMADVKGDLSGLAFAGTENPKISERVKQLKLEDFSFGASPVVFWDVFGEQGHPVRTTISEMGPLLLGRLMNLNETQTGVLTLVFKFADDNGMLLLDLKDLRSMVQNVGDHAKEFTTQYGNISSASIGAIQRSLLELETQGGEKIFGEPALNLDDFIQTDSTGKGIVNLLAADKLLQSPKLYSTLLLWLLSELFEKLPEVGDVEKPKLVFFFDEAHLLFSDAPKALVEKIEQVVRLVRSKGVGVYFVTQNPLDIPDTVLGQLGNRVQHALRAFTPRDQKAVKSAAETFRLNPKLNTEEVITQLGVGEALVSFLEDKGTPQIVERSLVVPPRSRLTPATSGERKNVIARSLINGHYEKIIDRESAYEILQSRAVPEPTNSDTSAGSVVSGKQLPTNQEPSAMDSVMSSVASIFGGGSRRQTAGEAMVKSAMRAIGSQVGRQLVRGIMGSLTGDSGSSGNRSKRSAYR